MADDNMLNLDDWYNPTQAAERLTKNSGKPVDISYVRTLARYGKVRTYQISARVRLYSKTDIDAYIVEERGEKSGRALRQRSTKPAGKKSKKSEAVA